jgi:hypothetical protein
MKTKNLGGIILGTVITGASLGVGFILAQKVMSKVGKKTNKNETLVIEETSSLTGLGLVKTTSRGQEPTYLCNSPRGGQIISNKPCPPPR